MYNTAEIKHLTDAAAIAWHTKEIVEIASLLASDLQRGLSREEAAKRLARGPNEIQAARRISA